MMTMTPRNAPPLLLAGEWFTPPCVGHAQVRRSAEVGYSNTGRRAVVHRHAVGEPCRRSCAVHPLPPKPPQAFVW